MKLKELMKKYNVKIYPAVKGFDSHRGSYYTSEKKGKLHISRCYKDMKDMIKDLKKEKNNVVSKI